MSAARCPRPLVTPGQRAQLFQRHDLVWLDDGQVWVVARRSTDDLRLAHLRLGRCSPSQGAPGKAARHAACEPESRIVRHRSALRVGEVLAALTQGDEAPSPTCSASLPPPWRATLERLQPLEQEFDIALRVYGSLAWQALTALGDVRGEPAGFLHDHSDLDVLVDAGSLLPARSAAPVTGARALPALLAALEACSQRSIADGGPRLDGEVRLPGQGDVAWRELLSASSAQVLFKDAIEVNLRPPPRAAGDCTDGLILRGASFSATSFSLTSASATPLTATSFGARPLSPASLDDLACQALRLEAMAWPKPGLVSPVDQGSHDDMDIALLLRAIDALEGWFGELARAAQAGARLGDLAAIGRCAEVVMLRATGGINAYKGAIFNLGLLVAGAAIRQTGESPADCVRRCWSTELLQHRVDPGSHGARVRARDGVGGAVREAASGFPTLMRYILPTWRAVPADRALQAACLAGIAHLDDTNLLWRGGVDGLHWAQTQARAFLASGQLLEPDWSSRLAALHADFVARHLSPGGSADLAACAAFLVAVE